MTSAHVIEMKIECAPWPGLAADAPAPIAELRLVCMYDLWMMVDAFPRLVCFRRDRAHDELWNANLLCDDERTPALGLGAFAAELRPAVRAPRGGTVEQSARRLFKYLLENIPFGTPADFRMVGLIDQPTYRRLVADERARQQRLSEAALERETPLVTAARRLGLRPEPSGSSPTLWLADCPGQRHRLHVSTASEEFGCGYCRRKGGLAELEAFVAERGKEKKTR